MDKPSITEIASTKRIPSLSSIAIRLLEIAQQDDPDYADVCRILRSDPAISGKVLQTANSALYGFRNKIESIELAVPKLGLSMIRTLILSFHLADSQEHGADSEPLFRTLWRNSLTQAVIAEIIGERLSEDSATFFSAGMLQDIGIHAMAAEHFEVYATQVLEEAKLPNVEAAEQECFGFDHIDVTLKILENWNLGETFIDAVRVHHAVKENQSQGDYGNLAVALQAATLGCNALSKGNPKVEFNESLEQWVEFLCHNVGFKTDEIEELIQEVLSRVDEYSVLFNFDIDTMSAEAVTKRAKELLQQIAVDVQMRLVETRRKQSANSNDAEIFKDYLTGLFNPRFLNEKLRAEVSSWVLRRKPLCLIYVDIDEFKAINDNLGHRVGDESIKHVSKWLDTCTRKEDYAIRLGGDEFLVVAQVSENDYKSIAERIATEVEPLSSSRGQVELSLSVGCVFFEPKRGDRMDLDWLIDQADRQMYAAKKNGGHELVSARVSLSSAT
ncbi:MAG: HDOD domain-containing protein [Pirellulaceae bacterium]